MRYSLLGVRFWGEVVRFVVHGRVCSAFGVLWVHAGLQNARNLLFHLGRRIHCGAGLARGKGGWRLVLPNTGIASCATIREIFGSHSVAGRLSGRCRNQPMPTDNGTLRSRKICRGKRGNSSWSLSGQGRICILL